MANTNTVVTDSGQVSNVVIDDMQTPLDLRVKAALQQFEVYGRDKKQLDEKLKENQRFFQLRHWDRMQKGDKDDEKPVSAWLLNAIMNKHADLMDNYPEPKILPREESDKDTAQLLSEVIPVVLEQNGFEGVYSDVGNSKLIQGTGVYGVFWNSQKNDGLGDIDIRCMDLLNMRWEGGITDIQKSRSVFVTALVDADKVKRQYPDVADKITPNAAKPERYEHDDTIDTTNKVMVIDWYYKVPVEVEAIPGSGVFITREVVHLCKICCEQILTATEDDPELQERGLYDHGRYPFEFDTLLPLLTSPVGMGYVDVGKDAQMYIDALDQGIYKSSVLASMPRVAVRTDGGVKITSLTDVDEDTIKNVGSGHVQESVYVLPVPQMPGYVAENKKLKVDELKETTGNRDFSQGGTTSGVTAASAIAALQEAGSKLSRDFIKTSYRAFTGVVELVIELMRQFYNEPRYYRIVGDMGQVEFKQFQSAMISMQPVEDGGYSRKPVFDIDVKAQKKSAYSTYLENQRAMELYSAGFFNPQLADQSMAALEMMDFEGIEQVRAKISQNGLLYQQVQMLMQQVNGLVAYMASAGLPMPGPQEMAALGQQVGGGAAGQQAPAAPSGAAGGANALDEMAAGMNEDMNYRNGTQAQKARVRAASNATPRTA